jgi:hypothetical protein
MTSGVTSKTLPRVSVSQIGVSPSKGDVGSTDVGEQGKVVA